MDYRLTPLNITEVLVVLLRSTLTVKLATRLKTSHTHRWTASVGLTRDTGIYVHTVRGGDDPAVTDDAAATLMAPSFTTISQTRQPRPGMRHSFRTADDTVVHERTDVGNSTVAA